MGPLVVLLILLSLSSLWVFIRFQPVVAPSKAKILTVTNRLFLGLGVVLAVLAVLRVYSTYAPSTSDASLLPGFAAVYALGLLTTTLVVGFVLRNFFIFRRASPF